VIPDAGEFKNCHPAKHDAKPNVRDWLARAFSSEVDTGSREENAQPLTR
jgi:hypothetical protein